MSKHQKYLKTDGLVIMFYALWNIVAFVLALVNPDLELFAAGVGIDPTDEDALGAAFAFSAMVGAVMLLVHAVVQIAFGMCCVRGANVPSKANAAFIFGIVLSVLFVGGAVISIVGGNFDWDLILCLMYPCAAYEAYQVKQEALR